MAGLKKFILPLLILYFAPSLPAQIVVHHNQNPEHGLVYSQVINIHQDRLGYLWLGTSSGLSRWDGLEYANYGVTEGLLSTDIQCIYEENDGVIYVGTRKGVYRFVKNRFEAIPNQPEELATLVKAIHGDKHSALLIATEKRGLWIADSTSCRQIFDADGQSFNGIRCITPSGRGGLLLGSAYRGVLQYNKGKITPFSFPQKTDIQNISAIFEDKRGRLFIGTQEGLYIVQNETVSFMNRQNGLPGNMVNHIAGSRDGTVYVATSEGVAIFKEGRLRSTLTQDNGLSSDFIWCIWAGKDGTVYFGTDGYGFDYYKPGVWTTINTNSGLPANTVWSILQVDDSTFYFSTDKGVARYQNGISEILTTRSGLSDNQVLCSFRDSRGILYFGNNYSGVDIMQQKKFCCIDIRNGLTAESVWTINEDERGRIYLGIYGGGICIMEDLRITDTLNTKKGLPSDYIVSSYRDADGSLIFGTEEAGAFSIKEGKLEKVFLEGNTIWSVYKNTRGNIFFGTNENGLIYHMNNRWDTLTTNDGLSNNCILGILEDAQGRIYLTTDNGFNMVDFSGETPFIRRITRQDGLAGNEFNQGSYLKDRAGRFWLGTTNGISLYRPWLDRPQKEPPATYIKRVRLYGRDLPPERLKTGQPFAYNENFFQFDFIGIDLSAPEKVKYRHRLSGIDPRWVETSVRHIQYTNLSPGSYTFEVQAANEYGLWSPIQQLSFHIAPPFWKTWWFIISVALLLGGLAWFLISMRIKRLLAIERLRSKIAADLHDDIGAGLSEINILSAVIEAKSPQPFKELVHSELTKIGFVSRRLIENMSDIVWMVNPGSDSLYDLLTHLKDSFSDILDLRNIDFRTDNLKHLESVHLPMESRQHVYMIFKEAINNAIKYSNCTRLDLSVKTAKKSLKICLADDGKGFDISATGNGNGLKNIKRRAEKIGGKITVDSRPGDGTKIEIEIKI